MSPSRSHTVGGVAEPPLVADEDDDICPVCESECTCGNREVPQPAAVANPPMPTPAVLPTSSARLPLKIKLTVPPHLKLRQEHPSGADSRLATHLATADHTSALILANDPQPSYLNSALSPQPKRRGRPPKAVVATREATRLSSQVVLLPQPNSPFAQIISDKKVTPSTAVPRGGGQRTRVHPPAQLVTHPKATYKSNPKSNQSKYQAAASSQKFAAAVADSDSDAYPTFVSAASSSSLTDSSESSECDSSSEESSDVALVLGGDAPRNKHRHQRAPPGKQSEGSEPETLHKRRDYGLGGRWEIRSRMRSVGPEEGDVEGESGEGSSDDGCGDDDEDNDAENDDAEADVEDESLEDVCHEDDAPRLDGKLGVSFGGWSEDEESSFDADIFFDNLDGSSDSSCSPTSSIVALPRRRDSDLHASFSVDEDDALLLMDIDSSVHVRRGDGGIEFSIPIDDLPFSWADEPGVNTFEKTSEDTDSDVDMTVGSRSGSSTEDVSHMTDGGVVLEETEGDTTEDELVDANGLPNPRAMMLFRWPATVSAIDPRSTVSTSKVAQFDPPVDASPSTRIALASFSARAPSPPPTPADILSGRRFSMDDIEDMEGRQPHFGYTSHPGGAYMGHFSTEPGTGSFAVVDGSGAVAPSPFPRRFLHNRRNASRCHPCTAHECSDIVSTSLAR